MNRLQRYLFSEAARSTLVLLAILLAVAMSGLLADALAQVARGRITPDMLLLMMGLNTLEALKQLVPLALFLGVVLSLTRLAQDQELVVMQASGLSPQALLQALSWLAVPIFLFMLVLGLWLVPWADRYSDNLVREARTRLGLSTLEPGRFRPLPGGGVIYVGEIQPGQHRFRDAFLYQQRGGREVLVTARHGQERENPRQREILLEQGWHHERMTDDLAWKRMHFAQNRLFIPEAPEQRHATELENMPLNALLEDGGLPARAEIRDRLGAAWSVWVLLLLALPLARLSPRAGRYGRIAAALLLYVIYGNLAGVARLWFERGHTPAWMGMEWLHLLLAVLALWWWLGPALPRPWARSQSVAPA